MQIPLFHIGNLIRSELEIQGHSIAWLAQKLNLKLPNCYRLLRSQSISTDQLRLISQVMDHDFFADCTISDRSSEKNEAVKTYLDLLETALKHGIFQSGCIAVEDKEYSNHYRYYYKGYGYVDCFVSSQGLYIQTPCVAELPYFLDMYAAALHICNECSNTYTYQFSCRQEKDKGKIYFDVAYNFCSICTMEQFDFVLEGLFIMGDLVREKVDELHEIAGKQSAVTEYLAQKLDVS